MTQPLGELPDRADVVVVGSGFGGSVVAEKLAAAGLEVCVLERGKAYPPGSFPRGPRDFAANFWNPSAGLYGLFNVWSFKGLDSVVASGLGGGSLIYANVMLRKPDNWFRQPHPYRPGVDEVWSFTGADLADHYQAVEKFLDLQTLPTEGRNRPLDPAFQLPKVAAFRAAPGVLPAPLAVQFLDGGGDPAISAPVPETVYPNLFGVPRRTCRMCGECDIGCNEGAKNTLDHTYLSAARANGATLHTLTEVRTVTRLPDGDFEVGVVQHRPEAGPIRLPLQRIRTRRVVLSAGALGSTYLLLTNRERLGLDNVALGTRFCGNGDLLGFILNVAQGLDAWRGPVITSYRPFVDEENSGDPSDFGMYLQDAAFPQFASWLVDAAGSLDRLPEVAKMLAGQLIQRVRGRSNTRVSGNLSRLLGRPSVTTNGMPVLGMGMDVPNGTLYLNRRRGIDMLDSTWSQHQSAAYFDTMVSRMVRLAADLRGGFMVNPTYRLRRVVTVHPLGGCPADTDVTDGVVDGFGRVRGVPGLRVCDGSVFPGPTGANPSLTIAAFADRVATHMRDVDDAPWPEVRIP